MARFVALLRGVNVGGGNGVPMAEWRAQLESLGYRDVATLLNSGNAVFTTPGRSAAAHAARIRESLRDAFAVDVPVIVKSAAELAAIRDGNPIAIEASQHSRRLVGFAASAADLRSFADLAATTRSPERLHVGRDALYLWCPDGISRSDAAKVLLGPRGRGITTRNWATFEKLLALV